jgi:hypothetical protein
LNIVLFWVISIQLSHLFTYRIWWYLWWSKSGQIRTCIRLLGWWANPTSARFIYVLQVRFFRDEGPI